jgi:hypothetical protein
MLCAEEFLFHLKYLLCHPSDILQPEAVAAHTHPATPVVRIVKNENHLLSYLEVLIGKVTE